MRVGACMLVMVLCLGAATAAADRGKVVQLGGGHSFQWSPDGSRLALMKGDNLWLYDVAQDTLRCVGALLGRAYAWCNDSQILGIEYPKLEKRGDSLSTVARYFYTLQPGLGNLRHDSSRTDSFSVQDAPMYLIDGTGTAHWVTRSTLITADGGSGAPENTDRAKPKYIGVISHCPPVRDRYGAPPPDTDVWLIDRAGSASRRVTFGKQYILPNLSPDGLKVTASDMAGHRLVLDTMGNEIGRFPGGGDSFWSFDSRIVYYSTVVQSEWDVIGGDIFAYSVSTQTSTQLTFSPDRPESEPRVSPDGTMLAYRGYTPGGKSVVEVLFLKDVDN